MHPPIEQRLWGYFLVGDSKAEGIPARARNVSRDAGYRPAIDRHIYPAMIWGATGVWIQQPFGSEPNRMAFDRAILAREQGDGWIVEAFYRDLGPVVNAGFSILGYLGTLGRRNGPGAAFQALFDADDREGISHRVFRSVDPILSIGGHVGMDQIVHEPNDSWPWRIAVRLRHNMAPGRTVWVENRPTKAQPHWTDFNTATRHNHLEPDPEWAVPTEELTRPCMGLVNSPPEHTPDEREWYLQRTAMMLSRGHYAAVPIGTFDDLGILKGEVCERARLIEAAA